MSMSWFIIRGSGIAAYVLLSAATIWGLLISTKVLGRAAKAKGMMAFHESAGIAALLATVVHLVALSVDEYVEFGLRELFVPGASTWEPMAVAFGITAFYSIFIVTASFYIKQWIGQAWWRSLHFLSFGAFIAATVHGVVAGTDTENPLVWATYVAMSVAVLLLLVVRIAQVRSPEPRRQRSGATRAERSASKRLPSTDEAVAAAAD